MLQVAWPGLAGMSLGYSFQVQSLRCKPDNGKLPASIETPIQGKCSPIMRVCSCEPGLYGCLAPIILWRPCAAYHTHIPGKAACMLCNTTSHRQDHCMLAHRKDVHDWACHVPGTLPSCCSVSVC